MTSLNPDLSLNTKIQSRFQPTLKNVGWCVMFIMALIILFTIEVPVLINPTHPARAHYLPMRWLLLPHIFFGVIATLAGPFQFSSRIKRRHLNFHRILGRVYVASIMIAAPLGAAIVIALPTDPYFRTGVCVHATLWFITTTMAFLTARNRQIVQHRQWMVRSYVLTFSFIIARILGPVWGAFHINQHDYGIVDCILNLCYLLGADIGLNWRELTTKRA